MKYRYIEYRTNLTEIIDGRSLMGSSKTY